VSSNRKSLTHFGPDGGARMVDVSDKAPSLRQATAAASVRMRPETLRLILDGTARKGDVLGVARLAGIMAAKRTAELIPLCHTLMLSGVDVVLRAAPPDLVEIEATARTTGPTGVEMEALTAAAVAALTVYDMCKAADRFMVVEQVRLIAKSGGASGDISAAAASGASAP
jgi:cyclic pyranopterin phosphate synthase